MAKSLTKKQRKIFDYIVGFIEEHGFAPSYREIAKRFDLASVATVHDHVRSLANKGYLRTTEGEARAIEIMEYDDVNENTGVRELPLYGLIAAGQPIEALDSKETVDVPQTMLGSGDYYTLQVKGDSMIEDGIFDGDYVIIEKREVANNGDVIVALVGGREATLKRFYKEASRVRLEPANSTMKPIFVKNDLQIQGKMIGLMRRY
ncbi:transcriptional repressor LexA [Patescibacteria group bacterium]